VGRAAVTLAEALGVRVKTAAAAAALAALAAGAHVAAVVAKMAALATNMVAGKAKAVPMAH
jgi:hypothetical protein